MSRELSMAIWKARPEDVGAPKSSGARAPTTKPPLVQQAAASPSSTRFPQLALPPPDEDITPEEQTEANYNVWDDEFPDYGNESEDDSPRIEKR